MTDIPSDIKECIMYAVHDLKTELTGIIKSVQAEFDDRMKKQWTSVKLLLDPFRTDVNQRIELAEKHLNSIDVDAVSIRVEKQISELRPVLKHIEEVEKQIFIKYGELENIVGLVCRDFLKKQKENYTVDVENLVK